MTVTMNILKASHCHYFEDTPPILVIFLNFRQGVGVIEILLLIFIVQKCRYFDVLLRVIYRKALLFNLLAIPNASNSLKISWKKQNLFSQVKRLENIYSDSHLLIHDQHTFTQRFPWFDLRQQKSDIEPNKFPISDQLVSIFVVWMVQIISSHPSSWHMKSSSNSSMYSSNINLCQFLTEDACSMLGS